MDNPTCSYSRFLEGDKSAFDDIMQELFHPLVFFINGFVHDVYTAEDIAIEVFSVLISHPKKYNFKSSLKTYLFMIGRCRALDYIKHCKVIEFSSLEDINEKNDEKQLEETVLKNEKNRALHQAIKTLPIDMQTVIHLIYFEDMTYEEAAKIMKKSTKQIDNLLYRSKKELRSFLEKVVDDLS